MVAIAAKVAGSQGGGSGGGGGTGTVTSVSATVNGVAATVTNPTTTPAIVVKSGGLEVADAAARLALTGYPVATVVKQTDTGFFYTLINSAAPGSEASWLVTPKVYAGYLSQSGTDAPTATLVANSLGGVPVFTRNSAGVYAATLAGAFGNSSWYVGSANGMGDPNQVLSIHPEDADTLSIFATDAGVNSDDILFGPYFEIRAYPA